MRGRELMLIAACAAIFVTVVVQGATLGAFIRLVRPVEADAPAPAPVGLAAAELLVARAKLATVEQHAYGPDGNLVHPQLIEFYRKRAEVTERYAGGPDAFMEYIRPHFDATLAAIAAGRAELIRLHRSGQIEDKVLNDLERDLDLEELGAILQRGTN